MLCGGPFRCLPRSQRDKTIHALIRPCKSKPLFEAHFTFPAVGAGSRPTSLICLAVRARTPARAQAEVAEASSSTRVMNSSMKPVKSSESASCSSSVRVPPSGETDGGTSMLG